MTILPNNQASFFFDFKNTPFLPTIAVVLNFLILVLLSFALIDAVVYLDLQSTLLEKQTILVEKQMALLETYASAIKTASQAKSSANANLINLLVVAGGLVLSTLLVVYCKNFIFSSLQQGPSNVITQPSSNVDMSSFPEVPSSPILLPSPSNSSAIPFVHDIPVHLQPLPPTILESDLSAMAAHLDLLVRFLNF